MSGWSKKNIGGGGGGGGHEIRSMEALLGEQMFKLLNFPVLEQNRLCNDPTIMENPRYKSQIGL